MWWVLVIPPVIWLGKTIYDAVATEEEPPSSQRKVRARPQIVFEERGDLQGDKVVVIGRTGAGKSSLINMLHGKQVLSVDPVASTTRWIEGVRVKVGQREAVLVDTPGYGETFTAKQYADGLVKWLASHADEVALVVLVIQSDAKAHAEDKRILGRVVQTNSEIPVVLVLTQVDKLFPVREPMEGTEWTRRKRSASRKNKHVAEKIQEICEQFGFDQKDIAPASAGEMPFNRKRLLRAIEKRLLQREK